MLHVISGEFIWMLDDQSRIASDEFETRRLATTSVRVFIETYNRLRIYERTPLKDCPGALCKNEFLVVRVRKDMCGK